MTYRNLEDNEVIQAGDEFHAKHDMEDCWDTVQGSIGSTPAQFTELKCEGMKWRRPMPTPTARYRDLGPNERIQEGDEFQAAYDVSDWHPVEGSVGSTPADMTRTFNGQCAGMRWRRPILTPIPGYRYLDPNERIQEGDEILHTDGMWRKTVYSMGRTPSMDTPGTRWRRPIKAGFITRAELDARIDAGILAKYNELILAVARVFPGETRHQTALRFIRSHADNCIDQSPQGL